MFAEGREYLLHGIRESSCKRTVFCHLLTYQVQKVVTLQASFLTSTTDPKGRDVGRKCGSAEVDREILTLHGSDVPERSYLLRVKRIASLLFATTQTLVQSSSPIVHDMFQSTAGPTKLVRDMLKTVHVLVMYVTIQAVLSFRARQCIHIRLRKHYKLLFFTSFTFLTFLPLSRLVPLFTSFLFSVVILAQVVCLHSCVVFSRVFRCFMWSSPVFFVRSSGQDPFD